MLKGYRFLLIPNTQQKELITKFFGCNRFVYNSLLCLIDFANDYGVYPTKFDAIKYIPVLKSKYPFLKEADSISLQQSVDHLFRARDNYHKGRAHEPTPKKKNSTIQSYTTLNTNNNIALIGKNSNFQS